MKKFSVTTDRIQECIKGNIHDDQNVTLLIKKNKKKANKKWIKHLNIETDTLNLM